MALSGDCWIDAAAFPHPLFVWGLFRFAMLDIIDSFPAHLSLSVPF